MKLKDYVFQSARHYWRGHLGLLFGTFLAATILTGSMLVGDSVRASLERVAALRAANPQASREVPVELVTASASGLDYSLTPAAAAWQIPRVAAARQLTVEQVSQLVAEHTQKPLVSFIGMPVVNIVELNLALDALRKN